MSGQNNFNHEFVVENIHHFIETGSFFKIFDEKDTEVVLKKAKLTPKDFSELLRLGSTKLPADKFESIAKLPHVQLTTIDEAKLILRVLKNYLKINSLDDIVNILMKIAQERSDFEERLKEKNLKISKLNAEIKKLREDQGIRDIPQDIITQIEDFSTPGDFYQKYEFIADLANKGYDQAIIQNWKDKISDYSGHSLRNVLHQAAVKGDLRLMQILVEKCCDKDIEDAKLQTPLIYASINGQLEAAKYLIGKGANKEAKDENGSTPLIHASKYGKLEVMKYLISIGCDVEAKDNKGNTALIVAAGEGQLEAVKLLIENQANKDARNENNESAIIAAATNEYFKVVSYLISIGVNGDGLAQIGENAFIWAAIINNLQAAKFLVSSGVDVNAKNDVGTNAIHLAAIAGHTEMVNFLINSGVNPNIQESDGYTPAHYAAITGKVDVLQLLHQRGADWTIKNIHGVGIYEFATDEAKAFLNSIGVH